MSLGIDEQLSEQIVYWQTLLSNKYGRAAASARLGETTDRLEQAIAQAEADDELMDALEDDVRQLAEETSS
jgi:hypothetical protein